MLFCFALAPFRGPHAVLRLCGPLTKTLHGLGVATRHRSYHADRVLHVSLIVNAARWDFAARY